MAYSKTTWQDLPNQTTPVNATNLNNMENGIETNDKKLTGTGEVIVESIRTKNMFDKNNIINNIRLGASGENVTDTNYFSSYFIQVKPNTTYTLSKGQSSDTLTVYCEYNSSKTFISRSSFITTTTKTFTTGSTTYFLRLSSGKININSLQLEEGSTATTYSPYQNLNGVSQPKTIYEGALQGTQSVTLSGVERYLKVYFTYAKESSAQIITYEIDTLSGKNLVYGSGIGLSSDGSNALNYYISESSYNVTTSLFTHTRAYWLVLPNTSNERNLNGGYIVYRIDTYN